jgi:hypothetical protein
VFVGLVVSLNGCDDPFGEEKLKLQGEVRRLAEEVGNLKAQNHSIAQERERLEREMGSLREENKGLKEQVTVQHARVSQLEEEVGRFVADMDVDGTAKAEPEAVVVPQTETVLNADTLRQEQEKRTLEVTKAITDLELCIKNLRVRIGRGQAKVSSLTKATVDARVELPPGAYIEVDRDTGIEYIYRRELTCGRLEGTGRAPGASRFGFVSEHRHSENCYTHRNIGPAVRVGDFRTVHDRTLAIEAAKTELLPFYEELRPLEKELAQLKEELGKLRKEKIEEGKRPESN